MTTATVTPRPPLSGTPADVIAWQKECIAAGACEVLGKIWMISLEASKGSQVPGKGVTDRLGSRMEWYNELGGTDVVGPRIAQTGPKGSLLIIDPFVRADDVVGLPDIPDPSWKPPIPTAAQLTGKKAYQPPRAPMIPQKLVCPCASCKVGRMDQCQGPGGRARGRLSGSGSIVVCGPVTQIVVRPLDQQQRILPNGLIFKCLPSTAVSGTDSTVMDLLVDLQSGEAFLYGGRFEIANPG